MRVWMCGCVCLPKVYSCGNNLLAARRGGSHKQFPIPIFHSPNPLKISQFPAQFFQFFEFAFFPWNWYSFICVCKSFSLPLSVYVTKFKKASKLWVNRFSAKITTTINPQTHTPTDRHTHTHIHTHRQTHTHTHAYVALALHLSPSLRFAIALCRFRYRYRNLFYRRISVWFHSSLVVASIHTHTHTHTVTHPMRHTYIASCT